MRQLPSVGVHVNSLACFAKQCAGSLFKLEFAVDKLSQRQAGACLKQFQWGVPG
jgi:hypothetical protein